MCLCHVFSCGLRNPAKTYGNRSLYSEREPPFELAFRPLVLLGTLSCWTKEGKHGWLIVSRERTGIDGGVKRQECVPRLIEGPREKSIKTQLQTITRLLLLSPLRRREVGSLGTSEQKLRKGSSSRSLRKRKSRQGQLPVLTHKKTLGGGGA